MIPKTIAVFFATALFASAAPTTTNDLVARSCTAQLPGGLIWVDKDRPDIGLPTGNFTLARTGGPGSNTKKAYFNFPNIPANATGCMLGVQWPEGSDFGDGANIADLHTSVPIDWMTNLPKWNNFPQSIAQVASVTLPTTPSPKAFASIVYSAECKPNMAFILELADWQQDAGSFTFFQRRRSVDPRVGFSLFYDC